MFVLFLYNASAKHLSEIFCFIATLKFWVNSLIYHCTTKFLYIRWISERNVQLNRRGETTGARDKEVEHSAFAFKREPWPITIHK